MKYLYVIPARGGSKGIPHKNIKYLAGKPLISYSIDIARSLSEDKYICVSTDDDEIIRIVEQQGLPVPFKRPDYLAEDTSGTYEVLLHVLDFYEQKGESFDGLVLLQPTSPLRTVEHVKEAISLFDPTSVDVVVSVCESGQNPYYNLFEDDEHGFLNISKGTGNLKRRQDAPHVWMFNGAVYVFNVNSLKKGYFDSYKRMRKFVMPQNCSVDLDTPFDWMVAEHLMKEKNL